MFLWGVFVLSLGFSRDSGEPPEIMEWSMEENSSRDS